jgi:large subunit ribosomal protein L9
VKVILRHDVDHLGDRGEIVNVAPGYARNYLVPKGLAMAATPGNIRSLELERKVWEAREVKEVDEVRAYADRLSAVDLIVSKKAGESETLYGSVTTGEIAELLAAKGFEIDRRKILLSDHIKSLGEFTVPVKLHRQVTAEIKLKVVAEEEE